MEVVRLLFVCLVIWVAVLLIMPDTGERSLLTGCLICIILLPFRLES